MRARILNQKKGDKKTTVGKGIPQALTGNRLKSILMEIWGRGRSDCLCLSPIIRYLDQVEAVLF